MSRHPAIRTPAERAARVAACTCIALLVAWAPQVRADADGVWSDVASPPSYREGPAVYDAQNDRLVVFGPPEPLNGYPVNPPLVAQPMALSLSDHTWTPLQTTNHPGCPSLPLFIVDEAHDRFVRWGGAGATTDTWVLSRATLDWSNLSPSGPPPSARSGATAIYDPVRHRMLLFGGGATTATFGHEVWALSLDDPPAWSQLAPTGTPPPDRGWHSAIYDPVGDRMVIFGGAKPVSGSLNDVWALSLAGTPTWSMITPAGTPPPTLSRSAVAYDPDGHRMFVHNFQTLWALTLSGTPTWSQIVSTGTTQPMLNHAGVWDTTRHRLLVAGGYIISGTYEMPVWSFDPAGSEWRRLNLGVPPHDDCMNVAVLDPVRDRMIVAGNKDSNLFPPKPWVSALQFNDPPPGWIGFDADFYNSAGMTYDPVGDRWIAFGGSVAGGVLIQEMLEILPSGTSAVLVGTGGPPPDRKNPGMVYDPVRQRVLVLGGQGNSGYPNDAWELVLSDPPAWTEILATGTPAAPALGAAIYDAVNDRVLMGADPLLALDLASNTWSEVATIGTPHDGPRAYDPVRNRLLFFPNPDSVWALSLSGTPTWSALAPTGPAPPPQIQSLAVYDPRRDRVVVTSWNTSAPSYNHYDATTWALTFGEPARPETYCGLALPPAGPVYYWGSGQTVHMTVHATNTLDGPRGVEWEVECERDWPGMPIRGLTVVDGGEGGSFSFDVDVPDTAAAGTNYFTYRTWYSGGMGYEDVCGFETAGGPVSVDSAPTAFAIRGANPMHGVLRFEVALPGAGRATLEVFDAAGRRVATRAVEGPGRVTVAFDDAGRVAPGVYVARLSFGGRTVTTRAAVIR